MSLYKIGDTFYGNFRHEGKRIRRSLGVTNRRAADIAYKRLELEILEGRKTNNIKLADYISPYLDLCVKRNTPATVKDKRRCLQKFLSTFTYLGDADRASVQRYFNSFDRTVTRNRSINVIKHYFNFLILEGHATENPVKGVLRLPEVRKPINVLQDEDLSRYFDWCRENDLYLYNVSMVAFYTGLRRGDILKLRGENVDLCHQVLRLRMSKTNEIITLPITEPLLEVFRSIELSGILFPHLFRKRFERALAETGLRFIFKDFRHNCATRLLSYGVDLATIQEILGHKSILTTRRYLLVSGESKREALAKLGQTLVKTESTPKKDLGRLAQLVRAPALQALQSKRIKLE